MGTAVGGLASPMMVLTGQTEKIGHFLQPMARATGQSVIAESPSLKMGTDVIIQINGTHRQLASRRSVPSHRGLLGMQKPSIQQHVALKPATPHGTTGGQFPQ